MRVSSDETSRLGIGGKGGTSDLVASIHNFNPNTSASVEPGLAAVFLIIPDGNKAEASRIAATAWQHIQESGIDLENSFSV